MTILCQGIGSPKPFQNLKPSLPQRAKHVKLFKMRRKVGNGFYSTVLMPLMRSEDLQNMLRFACTLCSSALLRPLCLG